MIKLFLAVVIFSSVAGLVLAAVKSGTQERIELQQLKYVKGPAILQILDGCSNDPLKDRFKIKDGDVERSFFVGVFDGKPDVVAFETSGGGFGGDIGVMTAVNLDTDKLVGVGVTTHSETPGVGSRTKTDPSFSKQFKGLPIKANFKIKGDGGDVDALSGATVSSKGVCAALTKTAEIYGRLKSEIEEKAKTVKP
jgi:electron transport complex protein RnfG